MPGIDESLTFHPLRIAVLTVSDTRTAETDKSGDLLAERLAAAGHELAGRAIVADEVEAIRAQVKAWVADPEVDIVITTGGTGFAPRDVTPEAIKPLFRREMDGFSTVFHQASLGTVGVSTFQSRAFAGQIGDTLHLLPARLDRRLPRRLGPGSRPRARQPLPALLARRPDSAAQGPLRMSRLSHVGEDGRARMVDVSDKAPTDAHRDRRRLPALPARDARRRSAPAPRPRAR